VSVDAKTREVIKSYAREKGLLTSWLILWYVLFISIAFCAYEIYARFEIIWTAKLLSTNL